jgi:hypothetical protein
MKNRNIPNALVGISGVHYVAFELSRRGLIALPTTRNTSGYDIVALSSDGRRHANIQVKTAQRRPGFWPMPRSEKIRRGPHDFYVLIRGLAQGEIECFLVTGKKAWAQVRKTEERMRKEGGARRVFPVIYACGEFKEAGDRWKKAWNAWSL